MTMAAGLRASAKALERPPEPNVGAPVLDPTLRRDRHLHLNLSRGEIVRILGTLIDIIGNEIKRGRKVQISGLGTFSTAKRKAHKGTNPKTGEPIKIAAMRCPSSRRPKR